MKTKIKAEGKEGRKENRREGRKVGTKIKRDFKYANYFCIESISELSSAHNATNSVTRKCMSVFKNDYEGVS